MNQADWDCNSVFSSDDTELQTVDEQWITRLEVAGIQGFSASFQVSACAGWVASDRPANGGFFPFRSAGALVATGREMGAKAQGESFQMAATRADLFTFLKDLGIEVTTEDHPAVFTVSESVGVHDRIPGGHTKNLFLKDKKGRLFLVVALHDAVIDLKTIHQKIGAQGRVSFGKGDLLEEVLGVQPGSVTPFALINDREAQRVTPILDAAMMRVDPLNFHPLENTATTTVGRDDLLRFVQGCGHEPKVIAVSEESARQEA